MMSYFKEGILSIIKTMFNYIETKTEVSSFLGTKLSYGSIT